MSELVRACIEIKLELISAGRKASEQVNKPSCKDSTNTTPYISILTSFSKLIQEIKIIHPEHFGFHWIEKLHVCFLTLAKEKSMNIFHIFEYFLLKVLALWCLHVVVLLYC